MRRRRADVGGDLEQASIDADAEPVPPEQPAHRHRRPERAPRLVGEWIVQLRDARRDARETTADCADERRRLVARGSRRFRVRRASRSPQPSPRPRDASDTARRPPRSTSSARCGRASRSTPRRGRRGSCRLRHARAARSAPVRRSARRASACDAGWSTRTTVAPTKRVEPPGPRVEARTDDHDLTVRRGRHGIVDLPRIAGRRPPRRPAEARTARRRRQSDVFVSDRASSTSASSSGRSSCAAIGSSKRRTARRPSATARPWQTKTAVRLARFWSITHVAYPAA